MSDSSQLALAPAWPSKWTVISGPMTGTVRLINRARFTLGRSSDCDFVIINDPKCSRLHATVTATPQGLEIVAESEKNGVRVNDEPIERAAIQSGDVVTIGDTQIQMHMVAPPSLVSVSRLDQAAAEFTQTSAPVYNQTSTAMPMPGPVAGGGMSAARILVFVIVGAVLILVLLPAKDKKKDLQLRGEAQIKADLEVATKLRETADKQLIRGMDQSVTARQAQENYVRGFRDYERGQFERALISFQSCLALNPDHVLCNRYMRLGQRKFDQVVQSQMVLGRKYRDQNQFRACRSAFRNVMVMIKDANAPVYVEAKANFDACDQLVEGHY